MLYRTKEELAEWRQKDPISTYRRRLIDGKTTTENELQALDEQVQLSLDEAVQFA